MRLGGGIGGPGFMRCRRARPPSSPGLPGPGLSALPHPAPTCHALPHHLRVALLLQRRRRVCHVDGHQGVDAGEKLIVVQEDGEAAAQVGHLPEDEVGAGIPEGCVEDEHDLVQETVALHE